jgi:hypothetical protein
MRKFLLATAFVLISAAAQAGQSRSLSVASVDEQPAATLVKAADATSTVPTNTLQASTASNQSTPLKCAETSTPDAAKFAERPPGVNASPATTAATQPQPADAARTSRHARASRPRHMNDWTEARIVGELHRHGIYW